MLSMRLYGQLLWPSQAAQQTYGDIMDAASVTCRRATGAATAPTQGSSLPHTSAAGSREAMAVARGFQ